MIKIITQFILYLQHNNFTTQYCKRSGNMYIIEPRGTFYCVKQRWDYICLSHCDVTYYTQKTIAGILCSQHQIFSRVGFEIVKFELAKRYCNYCDMVMRAVKCIDDQLRAALRSWSKEIIRSENRKPTRRRNFRKCRKRQKKIAAYAFESKGVAENAIFVILWKRRVNNCFFSSSARLILYYYTIVSRIWRASRGRKNVIFTIHKRPRNNAALNIDAM